MSNNYHQILIGYTVIIIVPLCIVCLSRLSKTYVVTLFSLCRSCNYNRTCNYNEHFSDNYTRSLQFYTGCHRNDRTKSENGAVQIN